MSVIVVTGSNTGIGFEIVKQIGNQLKNASIILCSRNEDRGKQACDSLKNDGINVDLGILDISDSISINQFSKFIESKYGKIDILINNAGFAFKQNATEPVHVQARVTIDVNYYGTMNITNALKPFISDKGKIINVSSFMGKTEHFKNEDLIKQIRKSDLSINELSEMMETFIKQTKNGKHIENGWPSSTYSVSKNGVSALTRIWARDWTQFEVNACCPGWCRTNMAGEKAPRSAAEGAETPVWLALREESTTGKFYRDKKEDKEW